MNKLIILIAAALLVSACNFADWPAPSLDDTRLS